MENANMQQNLSVATFDPAKTYAGASTLNLSESERKNLSAPFEDLDYEITPQGFIYLPQALSLKRLNETIGIGQWSLLLINTGSQVINMKDGKQLVKVFYDGALVIRNCFVARAAGEASYSPDNGNQSYATALEAAKSDCRQRCCKDLGIASDAWNPSFIRRWQIDHAVKVWVNKNGSKFTLWRRKDLPPLENEVGIFKVTPTVPEDPKPATAQTNRPPDELPWLNHGPDYDQAVRELLEDKTLNDLRLKWRISKETYAALNDLLQKEWKSRLETIMQMPVLIKTYEDNSRAVAEYKWLEKMFGERRDLIKSGKAKNVNSKAAA